MSLLTVIMTFIGLNIDTFIALLFVLHDYNYRLSVMGFGTATIFLWLLGVVIGKTVALLFPDWITGLMGIVLILLAVLGGQNDQGTVKPSFGSIFLFCLSLGGDNLAVYIPWAVNLTGTEILAIGIIFMVEAAVVVTLGKLITNIRPAALLIERYGGYGSRLVYVVAGLYIIWDSQLLPHLFV